MELCGRVNNKSFSFCTLDVYFSNVTSCYVNDIIVWSEKIVDMTHVHFNDRGKQFFYLKTAEGCKHVILMFVHDVMHVN